MIEIRKGQAPGHLSRDAFAKRFRESFFDPSFRTEDAAIARLEQIAWDNYDQGRKAPLTRKAGAGYADPDYDLSIEWIETRERLKRARNLGRPRAADARARDLRLAAQRRHLPGRDVENL